MKIIMYHYVRPIKSSEFPNLKGLELSSFRNQLDYFSKNYEFVTAEEVLMASKGLLKIQDNSVWLTFDDGYKDHYEYVLPELKSRNIQGSFFPIADASQKNLLPDVNAIQFIIQTINNDDLLYEVLLESFINIDLSKNEFNKYWIETDKSSRYDSEKTIFFKKMLQKILPEEQRRKIIDHLFNEVIGINQQDFCKKLYMSRDELKIMLEQGMFIGSHSTSHKWLDSLNYDSQLEEIDSSLEFLSSIGAQADDFIMCYPFGGYDNNTLEILRKKDCKVALTTEVGEANLIKNKCLELPRFDTNDFPQ